ncbi:SIR2 family anti-phage-associated protein [Sulfitobacter sp. EhC04]|uniref:SIR2 family anti-phage-associated protein n=1 Tax=Sulfitobacter sp. EhC04 TaxID=1849168 RepID=UPI002E25A897
MIAYRGNVLLSDEIELTAHLATLLRMENIGVLLGAGASVGCGGKTMAQLWEDFKASSPSEYQWLCRNKFVDAPMPPAAPMPTPMPQAASMPPVAPQAIPTPPGTPQAAPMPSGLTAPTPPGAPQPATPNVESLLDTLAIALAEWERAGSIEMVEGKKARAAIYRALVRASFLDESWWNTPEGVAHSEDRLSAHRLLLQRLTSARQPGQSSPWLFTTNYDLAIEWAADSIDMNVINGFLGLHSRHFTPQSFDLGFRNVQAKGEAQFGSYNVYLAKLHGSLTWKEVSGQFYEIQATEAQGEIRSFAKGETDNLAFTVLPSAAKYIQTVGFVLGELFRRYSEFLARPQSALLVSGYGFGDEHINRLLLSALLNPTFQLVVYLPEFSGLEDVSKLPAAAQKLLSLQSPRVTFVGGGGDAYFGSFVEHLPEPSIYNEDLRQLQERLRALDTAPNPNEGGSS